MQNQLLPVGNHPPPRRLFFRPFLLLFWGGLSPPRSHLLVVETGPPHSLSYFSVVAVWGDRFAVEWLVCPSSAPTRLWSGNPFSATCLKAINGTGPLPIVIFSSPVFDTSLGDYFGYFGLSLGTSLFPAETRPAWVSLTVSSRSYHRYIPPTEKSKPPQHVKAASSEGGICNLLLV